MSKINTKQEVIHSAVLTGDATVNAGTCWYYGYSVTVATAGATSNINIRDGKTAGGGQIISTIGTGKAVGDYVLPVGIKCNLGLFADYDSTATGSIVVHYRGYE